MMPAWLARRWTPAVARIVWALFTIAVVVATHWPRLKLEVGGQDLGAIGVDKLLHALTMAALMLLTAAAWRGTLWGPALFAIAFAYGDELTQQFVQRQASTTDLLANVAGVLAALGWLARGRWRSADWARAALLALGPVLLALVLMPGLALDVPLGSMGPRYGDRIEIRMDHLLHAVGALLGTWLLCTAAPFGVARRRWGSVAVLAGMFVTGPALEMVQHRLGRGFEVGDLTAHCLGVLLALLGGLGLRIAAATPRAIIETRAPATAAGSGSSYVRHARTVSGLTLLSRFTGLVRDAVLAATLGLSGVADAFFFGFLIPNLFRRLFGEGALSAAFIPIYSRLVETDRPAARRFASACIAILMIVLGVLTLIGEGVLLLLRHAVAWSSATDTALGLMMIMLPYMPLVCLVALIGGILNVHQRFAAPAAAPILLNVAMIAAALVAAFALPDELQLARGVDLIALSVVAAGVVQLAWQWWALRGCEPFTLHFGAVAAPLRKLAVTMVPMLLGLAVFQINTAMDTVIAFGLAQRTDRDPYLMVGALKLFYPIQNGAVAALSWAQRLYQFPLGVFGIAIATAIFPAMARAAARSRDEMLAILHSGLKLTVFIGLPASVGLIFVRLPLCRAIFQYGRFTFDDTTRVAFILAGYSACVWAYTMTHVLTRAFYALDDNRTPLKITVVNVVMNLLLNLTLIWYLGAAGLAWSTAICSAWQCLLLLRALRQRLGGADVVSADVWRAWGRCLLMTVVMAAALVPLVMVYDPAELSRRQSALLLAAMVSVGAIVYGGAALALRCPEVSWLLRRRA